MIVQHLDAVRVSPDDGDCYFVGYYDKQPWDPGGTRMLAHRTTFCERTQTLDDPCDVGFIDLASNAFTRVATTHAWNFQQGAHLTWVTHDGEPAMLFNDRNDDGTLCARVVTLDGDEARRYDAPIYATDKDKTFALTLDYARLTNRKPEYGYPGLSDEHETDPSPAGSMLSRLDLSTGELTPLFSINDLARHDDLPSDAGMQHINHIMVNPSGTRACVMHRFERADGILSSRLFTFNTTDGSDKRLIMSGMVSHYDWRDDDTMLAWAGARKLLGSGTEKPSPKQRVMTLARKTLKPVYYALGKPRILMNKIMKDSYLLIPDSEPNQTATFAKGELTCDGHCTYPHGTEHAHWVLTDGYPDMKSRQPLYLWDSREDQGYEIGRFFTPKELDGDIRVDLHPRWSPDASQVCIDSAMDTRRAIYRLDVTPILSKERRP